MNEFGAGEKPYEALISKVLAEPGYRARLRILLTGRDRFGAELAEALRLRAHVVMRRDPVEAVHLSRLALFVTRSSGDRSERLPCLRSFAQAALQQGMYPSALRAIDRAVSLANGSGEGLAAASLETLRLQALVPLEKYGEAERAADRALRTFLEAGDTQGVFRIRMALADLAFRRDRHHESLRHYARAAEILPPEAAPRIRGVLALNRANSLEAVNRFRAAERNAAIARELFSATVGCEHTVAQIDNNAAYTAFLRGRYEEALRLYARTEETFRELGDERHLAHIDLERAEIHLHLNLPDEALSLASRAAESFTSLGLLKERAQALLLEACALDLKGSLVKAGEAFLAAEEAFADLGLDARRFSCLVKRAEVAEKAGDIGEARRLAGEAACIGDGRTNPLSAATLELLLARLDLASGSDESALRRAEKVLQTVRHVHAPWLEVDSWRIAGRAHVAGGRLEEAVIPYRKAVESLEEYRGGVPPDEYMSAFLSGRTELYEETVELLVRLGDADLAFAFAERAKSRALVDLLAGRFRAPDSVRVEKSGGRRLQVLRERLSAVYRRLFKSDGESDERSLRAAQEARRQAGELETRIGRILRESRLSEPEAASLQSVASPDLSTIRRELGPDDALVEYFTTARATYIFLVTPTEVHVARTDTGEGELRQLLHRFRFHLAKLQRSLPVQEEALLSATRANLEKLSGLLLKPIADRLTARRLVVVPHGVLHHLPFHALPWEDGWTADRFEIVYAPSAAVYAYCGRQRPGGTGTGRATGAAVFALPDEIAPRIADEAESIRRALPDCRLYLGEAATRERLREEAGRSRILHIATHGMFRHQQPMLSSIRLADGWINLYDIYDLAFEGELIVLSSCESGTADVTDGNEILGLTRGFLYAGAPALLTTQWRVNDAVTTDFMERFYRELGDRGDVAAAYGRAMSEIRERHPHPYYWAPFFLTGRPVSHRPRPGAPAGGQPQTELVTTGGI